MKRIVAAVLTPLLLLLLMIRAPVAAQQQSTLKITTPDEFKAEFDVVPCKDDERLAAVKRLFDKAGASESQVSVEKYKSVENLVVRKQGATAETVVIGAHYDKVADGCGAIDNWTGVVAIAHLYATLKDVPSRKTLIFVAFGKEEKGLIGSQALVDRIEKDDVARYCAMVNIDSLGLAAPQVLDNASSKKLRDLAVAVAAEMKMPFSHASIGNADADSSSFVRKKIPALTLHGLNDQWSTIIHSRKDQSPKVNAYSVYLGYRLALALVSRLDAASCEAYK